MQSATISGPPPHAHGCRSLAGQERERDQRGARQRDGQSEQDGSLDDVARDGSGYLERWGLHRADEANAPRERGADQLELGDRLALER